MMTKDQLQYVINQYNHDNKLESLLSNPDDCITVSLYGLLYNLPQLSKDAQKCLESIWEANHDKD